MLQNSSSIHAVTTNDINIAIYLQAFLKQGLHHLIFMNPPTAPNVYIIRGKGYASCAGHLLLTLRFISNLPYFCLYLHVYISQALLTSGF